MKKLHEFTEEQIKDGVAVITKKDLIKPLPKTTLDGPKLYIFRHGQSEDNKDYLFSGWRDPNISDLGESQAETLAEKLKEEVFDLAISSNLKRAKQTLQIVLSKNTHWQKEGFPLPEFGDSETQRVLHKAEIGNIDSAYPNLVLTPQERRFEGLESNIKILLDDRVIERSYGDLQGTSKIELFLNDPETEEKYRRGYDFPAQNGESLKMVETRVGLFLDELLPFMRKRKVNVVVSCHSNSMRALRRRLENLTIEEMCKLENPLAQDYASYTV